VPQLGRTVLHGTIVVIVMITSAQRPQSKVILKHLNVAQIYANIEPNTIKSIKLILLDQTIYYNVENSLPISFLVIKINSVHIFPQDFHISLNTVLSCTRESSKISPSFTLPDEISVEISKLSYASCIPLLSHFP
jgi:hypothetical protein